MEGANVVLRKAVSGFTVSGFTRKCSFSMNKMMENSMKETY